MKPSFFTLILCLVGSVLFAQTEINYETEAFHSIKVGDNFHVEIEYSEDHAVTAEVPAGMADQIVIEVNDGVLTIYIDKDKWYKKNSTISGRIDVFVQCPELQRIEADGAAVIRMKDAVSSERFDLRAAGATDLELKIRTGDAKMVMAGAVHLEAELEAANVDLQTTGASNIELEGEAASLRITATGAAHVEAKPLKAGEVNVTATGAAYVEVTAGQRIEIQAEGGSTVRYACSNCSNQAVNSSQGSSVKKY